MCHRYFNSALEERIHFLFTTDLPNIFFDVFLCGEYCSQSLSESAIGLPPHLSFRKYSGDRNHHQSEHPDYSPQSLFHLSPYQLQGFTHVIVNFDEQAVPLFSLGQFYPESSKLLY